MHVDLNRPQAALHSLCLALTIATFSGAATAATLVVPGSDVSFDAPAGFTQLSAEELQVKYPRERAPAFAVGNESRGTTIACALQDEDLRLDQLQDAMVGIVSVFEHKLPGMQWKQHIVIRLHEQPWIYLELTSHAADTDIHNVMLMTSLRGKLFLCNFNSTVEEFPQVEAALNRSMQSIVVPK
jgi:hypothetical protein